ncbi:MAG: hypothetical protein ACP5FQ_01370 [Thermoplasmata archaeon]
MKEITGFEAGAVPPIGIRIRSVIDKGVLKHRFVIGSGGAINRLLEIKEYQNAEIIDIKIK